MGIRNMDVPIYTLQPYSLTVGKMSDNLLEFSWEPCFYYATWESTTWMCQSTALQLGRWLMICWNSVGNLVIIMQHGNPQHGCANLHSTIYSLTVGKMSSIVVVIQLRTLLLFSFKKEGWNFLVSIQFGLWELFKISWEPEIIILNKKGRLNCFGCNLVRNMRIIFVLVQLGNFNKIYSYSVGKLKWI